MTEQVTDTFQALRDRGADPGLLDLIARAGLAGEGAPRRSRAATVSRWSATASRASTSASRSDGRRCCEAPDDAAAADGTPRHTPR
jgi:hypothetical protein